MRDVKVFIAPIFESRIKVFVMKVASFLLLQVKVNCILIQDLKKILEVKIEIAIMNSKTDVEVRDIRSGAVEIVGFRDGA